MALIPAGTFVMGLDGPTAPANSKPAHKVTLRAFYIDKYEVTKAKYCVYLNEAKNLKFEKGLLYDEQGKMLGRPDGLKQDGGKWAPLAGLEKHPVVSLTWHGSGQFAKHFGKRLPTEAEWERAARGGTTTGWYFGDDPKQLDDYGWHHGNCPELKTHEVGLKKPNAFGLYDVYGNVYEVVSDWYAEDYYAHSPAENPQGPEKGEYHVRRGGSYYYAALAGCNSYQRVTTKIGNEPEATFVDSNWGVRTAADAPGEK
ncbi:MAG: SUMF1/EgtB/PvdO family nonheme iron enzyme [Planctomycetes bacterium]|nr:SUMF1/EgtB/PvdO family nonheme iron enzyme [Planctomycetota bacterium]